MRVLRIARGGRTKWLPQAISTRVCRLGDVCLNLLFFLLGASFFFDSASACALVEPWRWIGRPRSCPVQLLIFCPFPDHFPVWCAVNAATHAANSSVRETFCRNFCRRSYCPVQIAITTWTFVIINSRSTTFYRREDDTAGSWMGGSRFFLIRLLAASASNRTDGLHDAQRQNAAQQILHSYHLHD